jgi:ketosteroid isomerase-like protein
MSERAELTRRGYDAWNRRDWDLMFEFLHPDIEWVPMQGGLLGDTYRGTEHVREFFALLFDAWDEFRIDVEDVIETDDRLLAIVRVRTRGRGSGVEVDERWAHVWTADEEGLATRLEAFDDLRKGYEAVGLTPP